ncbi:hypothetical protein [Phyllobacterium sp. SB3]|uniref:hypothetical protein n=1 Tax=Phyllobacterium sp. SB3 TaxID=3156073 RepID=UPI0032AFC3C8
MFEAQIVLVLPDRRKFSDRQYPIRRNRRSWKKLAPPTITKKTKAVEILRLWAHLHAPQEIILKTMREDPGA